ncbi:unnamed protein product [Bacillus phage SPP1]|uniref:Bacteriophage SPP1 complete nucleotide sequence n=1 Tax=Bacillus phage SPP1 TaxID=10724 RepID=O48440_BPSPP|nr:hypothetical protein SPP1p013 [Bacillus phage SPP1]CAA66583.1 unnamed protein product [Bacillus phage SPP1]
MFSLFIIVVYIVLCLFCVSFAVFFSDCLCVTNTYVSRVQGVFYPVVFGVAIFNSIFFACFLRSTKKTDAFLRRLTRFFLFFPLCVWDVFYNACGAV